MNKEFKKNFFTCLMAVLLVVSNIIGMKLTNFLDITIGVDFITYPFTFLCTLMLINLGGKKDAYRSILVASVIQLLITISYAIIVALGTQTLMPDSSSYVNALFKVNQLNILGSVLAFIVSHCLLIYIYENFKHFGRELYGLVIGLLGSLFLNSVIYLLISLRDYEAIFVINMLLSNVIIDIVMIVIITVLFYILREKNSEKVIIKGEKENTSMDLGTEEIMINKTIKEKKETPKTTKKNTNNRKSTKTNNSKTTSKSGKKTTKTVNNSKKTVKKENN
ncbi:MAG: VUT family protein [Bacilli bacterium]|nr:VUT family protein [Bacilli bacterium]